MENQPWPTFPLPFSCGTEKSGNFWPRTTEFMVSMALMPVLGFSRTAGETCESRLKKTSKLGKTYPYIYDYLCIYNNNT